MLAVEPGVYGAAWREMGPEWTGSHLRDPEYFPLLVKFIFPDDKLSIQVHPEDDYAGRHEAAAGRRAGLPSTRTSTGGA